MTPPQQQTPTPQRIRSAVVTGGSSGIGLATATVLHAAGVELTLAGRRADRLAAAAQALAADGGAPVHTAVADLADPDAPQQLIAEHVARTGRIDALVAAAGDYSPVPLAELTAEVWDATLDVHLRGVVLCAAAAARWMAAAGHGRIVLLSSVNGFHAEPDSVTYSAAKTAVISLARSLAVEFGARGVSANAVAPGWVYTPMTAEYLDRAAPQDLRRVNPLGRAGRADEIAGVIGYLLLDAPDFLTGATLVVDGGQTAQAPMP